MDLNGSLVPQAINLGEMLVWILISSAFVIGFHVVLKLFKEGKGDLATSLHPIRRIQHFLTGILVVFVFGFASISVTRAMITAPSVIFFIFDIARRKYSPGLNKFFLRHWEWLLRPHEYYDSPPAALSYLCGIAVATWVVDSRPIIVLCVLFVSTCDPAASVFGILIGGYKITEKKSLAGTTAAGISGAIITKIVFTYYGIQLSVAYGFIIAVLAEFIDIKQLNDNFTIPVISCLLWKAVFSYADITNPYEFANY